MRKYTIFIFLILSVQIKAQTYSFEELHEDKFGIEQYYLFTFNDNTKLLGQVQEIGSESLTVYTNDNSTKVINFYDIKKVRVVSKENITNDNYWFPNPLSNKYLYHPSAFTAGKRKGYVQNIDILLVNGAIGITDNFDIAGSAVLLSDVFALSPRFGNLKIAKNTYAALTYTYLNNFGQSTHFGYALTTYGNENSNITIGAGLFKHPETNIINPSFQFNGMYRFTEKFSLVLENMLTTGEGNFIYHGIAARRHNKNWSIEIGGLFDSISYPKDYFLVYVSGNYSFQY